MHSHGRSMVRDFLHLESSILTAVVDRRWDRLASLLDDDFVITTAGWLDEPATKQAWIKEVSTRHLVHKFDIHAVDVHDMGNVAVVLVHSTQWATWKNSPFKGEFRYTDVWRKGDSGSWRLAVRHASLVPQAEKQP
jgi:ketosteroid isomerase-like protein